MIRFFSFSLLFQLVVIFILFVVIWAFYENQTVQAENSGPKIFYAFGDNPIETKSQFEKKIIQKKQKVSFGTIYQKDQNLEWGKIVKNQQGLPGENLIVTETLFWKGREIGKRTNIKEISKPQPQINLIGTKLTPGEIVTPTGKLAYKGKAKVFATSYDKNCRGCNGVTATGSKLAFGVVAVDQNFIPLGSKIYVPGYGQALAADTGGAVKGAKIDLAFDDVRNGFWRSRWIEVYLLE